MVCCCSVPLLGVCTVVDYRCRCAVVVNYYSVCVALSCVACACVRCEVDTDEVWPSLTRVFLPSSDPQLVHVETPSNPLMRITDIRALADALHEQGVLLSVDATMMTPLLMRPLDLGAVRLVVVVHGGRWWL